MGRELKNGEQVLLRGSAGALFRVTVGQPFTKDLIERRIKAGEWGWPGTDPAAPASEAGPEPRTEEKSKPKKGEDSPKPRTELASDPGSGDGPQPREETVSSPKDTDPDRPAVSAPKSEWVIYAARTQHMSREDAANYTKADLIDMVS
ncbi:hypothetical protein CJI59_13865 [Streptomyces sp. Alain-F2R5]|nr:hypothetical protein [Streptomyces sp. Alain-F2R5]PAN01009.1 hypothetical protein CJI59_13865 [Streptomyces sp. Alain-F2R5]